MPRARFQCAALLLFLAIAPGGPRHAAAQIGKLKKVVTGKAVASGKLASCMPDRSPTVVASLSLTPAQIAKINAGLDAELATHSAARKEYEQRLKASEKENEAYQKAHAEWEKKNEQYTKCADKVREADAKKSEDLNARAEAAGDKAKDLDAERMTQLAERAQAAAERVSRGQGTAEDRATLAEFQKSMAPIQAMGAETQAAMQESAEFNKGADARVEKACGKKPEEPKAPEGMGKSPERTAQEAGAKAAGMDAQSYAEARDLLLGFVMANTVVASGNSSGGGGASQGAGQDQGGSGSQSGADATNQGLRDAAQRICAMRKAGVPI
jgi:membrane protein involved in colicin uptake